MNCSTAGWGCIDCKKTLFNSMEGELAPIRARAAELRASPAVADEALATGTARAREVAAETIAEVQGRMGIA